MEYLFVLSKENIDIAIEEILALLNLNECILIGNLLILNIKNHDKIKILKKRLAYAKCIYSLLFESSHKNFLKNMEDFEWNKIYKDNFCIRANIINTIKNDKIKLNYSEKNLASYVWKKVKNPKVDLKDPKTKIEIFFLKDKVLCCLLDADIKKSFESRKSHLRPRPSPISLHPKLARAMVNLTGIGRNETILDPFCGSGGILLEAGLMGLKSIGYDISKKMIWKSMVNLKHYKIKDYKLKVKDFFKINKKYKYVVSDLPYGLNTNIMKNINIKKTNKNEMKNYLDKFYNKVVKKLEKILTKKAVIIFPSYISYKKIIKKSKLKIINEFESYVHNNLTRKIVVLEPLN
ncbi:hypothetical protein CL615_01780 [archaeon]|jgi:tRNA (guanine10-N2)-dimethyltransferase|nr:hypothetical protein [archaeon]MDP6547660.1 DNA methyltransferase [Candidatus Woesearchaeota archaeon]|tara:strand:- start:2572 stop:3615 length:1044 start_codon:yes stop_codon:yes gene_type:complete